jgi:hypothetical protein
LEDAPGLAEFLAGRADAAAIATCDVHENLLVVPAGSAAAPIPERDVAGGMQTLLSAARWLMDVIIVESPALDANAGSIVMGCATGNLVVMLEDGRTHPERLDVRLRGMERWPLRVLGAVVSVARDAGPFRHYLQRGTTAKATRAPRIGRRHASAALPPAASGSSIAEAP